MADLNNDQLNSLSAFPEEMRDARYSLLES